MGKASEPSSVICLEDVTGKDVRVLHGRFTVNFPVELRLSRENGEDNKELLAQIVLLPFLSSPSSSFASTDVTCEAVDFVLSLSVRFSLFSVLMSREVGYRSRVMV